MELDDLSRSDTFDTCSEDFDYGDNTEALLWLSGKDADWRGQADMTREEFSHRLGSYVRKNPGQSYFVQLGSYDYRRSLQSTKTLQSTKSLIMI